LLSFLILYDVSNFIGPLSHLLCIVWFWFSLYDAKTFLGPFADV
jgi:hypothetical protein